MLTNPNKVNLIVKCYRGGYINHIA